MVTTRLAVVALALCAAVATAHAQSPREAVDIAAPRALKAYGVPSVSIAVVRDDAVVWTAAYGEQSPGVPATTDTLYNIASMTKPITAEVVMRLASQGKLSLDESMSPYWIDPDIRGDARHQLLTPRFCLTHRTGFPNWRRETNKVLTFQFDPGTKSSYSGEGYEYLARFVEKKIGRSFDALAQELVFAPLGMTQTAHTKRPWFKGRVALPFDKKFLEPDFAATAMASDLVYTTAADYAKLLVAAMKNDGVDAGLARERTVTPEDLASQVCGQGKLTGDACPARLGFGLGWAVVNYKSETVVMHGGSDTGVKTQGYFVPERRFGMVILTNGENGMKVIRDVVAAADPATPYVAFLTMQAQ